MAILPVVVIALGAMLQPDQPRNPAEEAEYLKETFPQASVNLDGPPSDFGAGGAVRMKDADGNDLDPVVGLLVEPGVVVMPLDQLERASSGTIRFACCDPRELQGVIAFDVSTGLALVAVDDTDVPPTMLIVNDVLPDVDSALTIHQPTPVQLEGWVAWMGSDEKYALSRREWAGRGVMLHIGRERADKHYHWNGTLVLTEDRELGGLINGWGGRSTRFVVPLGPVLDSERSDPVPLAEFAARERAPDAAARYHEQLASDLRTIGRLEDAEREARRAIEIDPDRWYAWYTLGVISDLRGEPDGALERLARAAEIEPGFVETWYSRGLVHLKAGRYGESIEAFDTGLDIDDEHAECNGMKGVALLYSGRAEAASWLMLKAQTLEPWNITYATNVSSVLEDLERDDEIVEVWTRFTEAQPDDLRGWTQLGRAEFLALRYEDARKTLTEARELGDGSSETLLFLSISTAMLGELEEALSLLDDLLEQDPTNEMALEVQELMMKDMKEMKEMGK